MNTRDENEERIENEAGMVSSKQPSALEKLEAEYQYKMRVLREKHHQGFINFTMARNQRLSDSRKEQKMYRNQVAKLNDTIKVKECYMQEEMEKRNEDLFNLKNDYEESCFQYREEKDKTNDWMRQEREKIFNNR